MSEHCYRCQGFVGLRYDSGLREWERYCVNCGALQDYRPRRRDGGPVGELLCVKCGVNPRSIAPSYQTGGREVAACLPCRIEGMRVRRKRRELDFGRNKRLGNLKTVSL